MSGKHIILYVGEDIFRNQLSEEEQKKFKLYMSYDPDYLNESFQEMEESDPDADWMNEDFKDTEDYEDFVGMDWDSVGLQVYKRRYETFTEEDKNYFLGLAEKEDGNQIRIKEVDEDFIEDDDENNPKYQVSEKEKWESMAKMDAEIMEELEELE